MTVNYASDGYLSEAQYLEKLTTPLGGIDATVFANWDLLKVRSPDAHCCYCPPLFANASYARVCVAVFFR